MFDNLCEDNILLYCVKAYDKPNCIMSEFEDDMKRFNYINRLFTRYKKFGEIKQNLILNHIVVVYNVFGPEVATRLLFFKTSEDNYSLLKTFLIFLNLMPEKIKGIHGRDIISSDIDVDMNVANQLRKIR